MLHRIYAITGLVAMTACASPIPPTIDQNDISDAQDRLDVVSALPATAPENLPTASATYVGVLGSEANVDGDDFYAILGDLRMTVDFGGTNGISGTVSDVNLIEDGVPDQALGGELALSGNVGANGRLGATAQGTLTGVGDEGFRGDTETTLTLTGNLRDENASGDVVTGSVTGFGRGDFDVDLFGENGFAATAE